MASSEQGDGKNVFELFKQFTEDATEELGNTPQSRTVLGLMLCNVIIELRETLEDLFDLIPREHPRIMKHKDERDN